MSYTAGVTRATNVTVTLTTAAGVQVFVVNEKDASVLDANGFLDLATVTLDPSFTGMDEACAG